MVFESGEMEKLISAIHNQTPVEGCTHTFYRYPARFSPFFAEQVIKMFTKPGDLVLDPFMGGGTTLVEASRLGRTAVGCDINELAVFVSQVKTTPLTPIQIENVLTLSDTLHEHLNIRLPLPINSETYDPYYQRNISCRKTWRIRKTIAQALFRIGCLQTVEEREFARCVILKTAQWALDNRTDVPNLKAFREELQNNVNEMTAQIEDYSNLLLTQNTNEIDMIGDKPICLNRSVIGIEKEEIFRFNAPKLVLTSPPYPGVHILYHRWQVKGRKETPAPYWIANRLDGNGESYYTLGNRKEDGLNTYYTQLESTFRSLCQIMDDDTILVQLVAFPEPSWQLPRYIDVLDRCGLLEINMDNRSSDNNGRLWRNIPNRKWYARNNTAQHTGTEVVLFHRLKTQSIKH